jgi:cytoskeletal protein RodZ
MKAMLTVAEQLRAAREDKKLTVQQVADATKIRTDHIRALEEGDYNVFSATVYIRGSVKIYAALLKLDPAPLLAALAAELKTTIKFSEPPPLVETRKTFLDTLILLLSKLNWKVGFAGVAAIAVVVVIGLSVFTWRHQKKRDPLANLPPAVYQPASSDDTLPLPKR